MRQATVSSMYSKYLQSFLEIFRDGKLTRALFKNKSNYHINLASTLPILCEYNTQK